MNVWFNGKKLRLKQEDIVGAGGEASVFQVDQQAVKIYTQPTPLRSQKIEALLGRTQGLPASVIAPQALVYDQARQGQAVGFAMRLLGSDFIEVRQLSSKKYRAQMNLSAQAIARLFLKGGEYLCEIHQSGLVVGDLNDLNLMTNNQEMIFIDVDSFQFDQYPCMVGTEAFLDPDLYNVDLSQGPCFAPENDWYAYLVLLCKSLLMTHPYGGVHPDVKLLTQRAHQRISVFDSAVKYPAIAISPDILSDELGQVFHQWFTEGYRGAFDLMVLEMYASTLKPCPSCATMYPRYRARCPQCSTLVPIEKLTPTWAQVLLKLDGDMIAWHVTDESIQVLTHEADKVVYYQLSAGRQLRRISLFKAMAQAQYAFAENQLVISPSPDSEDLLVVDISQDEVKPILRTVTEQYGGRSRVFEANSIIALRIVNGYLMKSETKHAFTNEKAIMPIAKNQTWLKLAPNDARVVGHFRTFDQYHYWFHNGAHSIDLSVHALESDEALIQQHVCFGKSTILILRHTRRQGVERLRLDEFDGVGQLLYHAMRLDIEAFTPLDGIAYERNMILYASEQGVTREVLKTGELTHFKQTEPFVHSGVRLLRYQKGLLTLTNREAIYLTI